jgi:hypothetical protein
MHFMHGLADSNVVLARHVYQESYSGRRDVQTRKYLQVLTPAFVNTDILHLMLPTGNDQDLLLLLY